MPEVPVAPPPAEAAAPRIEKPKPTASKADAPTTKPASLDMLQSMGDDNALDALRALGTPTFSKGELQGKQPTPNSSADLDTPPSDSTKTIEDALTDLANSPNTPPSPDEEAAIARAKQTLNPDAQESTPTESVNTQTDVTQQNENFINAAKFKEPSASERAAGAKVTEVNQTPTENVAPPVSTETPAAEAAVDPQTITNEVQVDKATGTESEGGEPTDPQVEAALRVHKLLGQIESVNPNFDAGSDTGRALIKDLMENPEAADKVSTMLDTAKNTAAEAVAALSASGININADQLTAAMIGNITEQYIAQLTQEQAGENSDPANTEVHEKRNILMKILKTLGKAITYTVAAAAVVPLAAVGAGALAMSKK